ncbi:uncharacterized protein V1518DRAFT_417501 [Limtongia smithiae]|uniref:uncharacterized protein n=1 Tax=Limtongia smithiae TaxID=1125753 RepID=UPI0034CD6B92
MSAPPSQQCAELPVRRSKRVLVSTHAFPRYHAPVSRFYCASDAEGNYPRTPAFTLYSTAAPGAIANASDSLPPDVQRSLLHIGMRVRKSVSEGYMTSPTTDSVTVSSPPISASSLPTSTVAKRGWSDSDTLSASINPYLDDPNFAAPLYARERKFAGRRLSRRCGPVDERPLPIDGANKEHDMTDDNDDNDSDINMTSNIAHSSNSEDEILADSQDSDFTDAPFLVPKETLMQLDP